MMPADPCSPCSLSPQRLASHIMASSSAPLTEEQRTSLRAAALAAAEHSYSPYSRFRVGAALLLTNGDVVTGANVENASYRLTVCAEQAAIAAAVALHGHSIRIRAVVIANLNKAPSQPCGACRQTIHEFSTPSTEIFFPTADGALTRSTITGLLPSAFLLNNR